MTIKDFVKENIGVEINAIIKSEDGLICGVHGYNDAVENKPIKAIYIENGCLVFEVGETE